MIFLDDDNNNEAPENQNKNVSVDVESDMSFQDLIEEVGPLSDEETNMELSDNGNQKILILNSISILLEIFKNCFSYRI